MVDRVTNHVWTLTRIKRSKVKVIVTWRISSNNIITLTFDHSARSSTQTWRPNCRSTAYSSQHETWRRELCLTRPCLHGPWTCTGIWHVYPALQAESSLHDNYRARTCSAFQRPLINSQADGRGGRRERCLRDWSTIQALTDLQLNFTPVGHVRSAVVTRVTVSCVMAGPQRHVNEMAYATRGVYAQVKIIIQLISCKCMPMYYRPMDSILGR